MTLASLESLSFDCLSLAAGVIARSLILAGLCGVAAWLLRSRTAAVRHLLWKSLLWTLLLLPVLLVILPPLERTSGPLTLIEVAMLPKAPAAHVYTSPSVHPGVLARSNEPLRLRWLPVAATTCLLVTFLLLLRLCWSLWRLDRIAARSEAITEERFRHFSHDLWLAIESPDQPRIAVSHEIPVPVTFGLTQTQILLPMDWPEWDQPALRAVLMHELAHAKRQDFSTALLAAFATCLFWFHPLSWFLQRRLSALAEEACDEQVLRTVAEPQEYATILLRFARVVKANRGRTLSLASAVVRSSRLKTRIERLFLKTAAVERGRRLLSICIVVLFVPVIYLAAASRFEQPSQSPASTVVAPQSNYWQLANTLSPEDEARLSAELQEHPDDLDAHSQLLVYYQQHNQPEQLVSQLLWFIEHHPDSPLLSPVQMMLGGMHVSDAERDQIASAWRNTAAKNPQSAPVLQTVAEYFIHSDPKYALQLFAKVQQLDPSKAKSCESWIERIYAAAEMRNIAGNGNFMVHMTPDMATELDSQLEASNNPSLLSGVGNLLVRSRFQGVPAETSQRGFELMKTASALDPGNPAWQAALDSAKAEPMRQRNAAQLSASGEHLVRIGGAVAEANLAKSVDPVYPPLALAARIQGSVEFTVVIGTDGHVQRLELVRGHPLLVNAAKDAVLRRVYKPTLLNGQPIAVITDVTIPFRLPQ